MFSKHRERLATRLSRAEIFSKLPLSSCIELANITTERKLVEDEFGCRQGEIWPYIIYLDKGELNWIMLSADGRKQVLFTLHPGDVFWGQSMFDGEPIPASLHAVRDSVYYRWHRDTILPVFYQYPDTLWELAGKLTKINQQTHENLYGIAFQPTARRLAKIILEANDHGNSGKLQNHLTIEGIASRVSVDPDDVCRVLEHLQHTGILKVNQTVITVLDRPALEKMATIEDDS